MNFLKNLFQRKPKVEKVDLRRRFELIGRVGQGSMSRVWKARDVMSGRLVAVKVLDKAKTVRLERRFIGMNKPSEGFVALSMRHPHVVKTLEHGITIDDEQYLVMEYVDGVGLSYLVDVQNERMQRNRLWYMIQLGQAIDYLERHQWIHRDICPRNIIVTDEERLVLIDFGLVVPNTEAFRAPGNRTGTANYMAPELIKRLRTDHRIDIFSYAVACYEMCTRSLPWPAADTMESVMQHINQPPADLRKVAPELDEQVAVAIMRGLEADPDRRWQHARDLVEPLREAAARLGLPGGE